MAGNFGRLVVVVIHLKGNGVPMTERWQIAVGNWLRDVRFAGRVLARNPGFTAVVALSVALGIAANTTVFSLVNTLLLGSLPVRNPDRLVSFSEGQSFPYPDYQDYRSQVHAFQDVSARFPLVAANIGGGQPERVWGQVVTGNYFQVLGLEPAIGRDFALEEKTAAGREHVVVISHALWQRRFGGTVRRHR